MATAQDALNRARDELNDPSPGVTWTDDFLRRAATDGQREVVKAVPAAYAVAETLTLTASVAQQVLPAGSMRLLKITHNLGLNGSTPGRVIKLADEGQLDAIDPNWRAAAAKAVIRHYTYDIDQPLAFNVYPPPEGALRIAAVLVKVPPELTTNGTALVIGDEYLTAVVQWMLYRAWLKNSPRKDTSKAEAAKVAFYELLGVKNQVDDAKNPDKRRP